MLKVPVLLYHAVDVVPQSGLEQWTIAPPEFLRHADVIAASGRVPLTISELAQCLRGERRMEADAVAVTFDDGYASTHEAALELLRRDIRATIYLTTGAIGATGMLSAAQVQQLAKLDGIELGAHSVTHPKLDELGDARLDDEVAGSKRDLEALVGSPVKTFAYPHGSYDRRARAAVMRAGYHSAAAVKNALSHLEDDPFAIARWTVTAHTSSARLAAILRGENIPLAWRNERLRTRAHRVVRQARRRLHDRSSGIGEAR